MPTNIYGLLDDLGGLAFLAIFLWIITGRGHRGDDS